MLELSQQCECKCKYIPIDQFYKINFKINQRLKYLYARLIEIKI